MDSTTLTTLGVPLGAAYIAQLLTNYVRGIAGDKLPAPELTLPVVAFLWGMLACGLYGVAAGIEVNKQGIAKFVIQGFFAAAFAVWGTETHKNARAE